MIKIAYDISPEEEINVRNHELVHASGIHSESLTYFLADHTLGKRYKSPINFKYFKNKF